MKDAFIIAARRTPVAPRNGAFRTLETFDLTTPLMHALLSDAGLAPHDIEDVILGNALYAGGNPARICTLAAGLPEAVPALTIDTQCCAGLDAIALAASRIRAGEADVVLAGGVESYSRAPLRARRPLRDDGQPAPYDRPPFSPWPDRDPDLIAAAAALAATRGLSRAAQEDFAIHSHAKALDASATGELTPIADLLSDAFSRRLNTRTCNRMPILAGDEAHGLTAATTAVEADAAAMVLVVSSDLMARAGSRRAIRIGGTRRAGLDPAQPTLGAQAAAAPLLKKWGRPPVVVELMESFAAQAMAAIDDLDLDPNTVNRRGGALSRGHPIGASGAILAVRLFHELLNEPAGALGLAAIAAAGGLGSAALFERV